MKSILCKSITAEIERKKKEKLLPPTLQINHHDGENGSHASIWETRDSQDLEMSEGIKPKQHGEKK